MLIQRGQKQGKKTRIKCKGPKPKKKKKIGITGWKILHVLKVGANNLTGISQVFRLYTKQQAAAPVRALRLGSPQEALEVTNIIFHSSGSVLLHLLPWSRAPFTPAADPSRSSREWQLWLQHTALQATSVHALLTSNSQLFLKKKSINSYKVRKGERVISTDGKSLSCQIPPRAISAATALSGLLLTPLYFCDTGNLMAN